MSDQEQTPTNNEEKWKTWLARATKDLLFGAAFILGGFICLIIFQFVGMEHGWVGLLMYAFPGIPVLMLLIKTRSVKSLLSLNYSYTETTWSDGTKTDNAFDMGLGAIFVKSVLLLLLAVLLCPIIAFIRFVWFAVKSIVCYCKVKEKPSFLFSPFMVLIGLAASIVVITLIYRLIRLAV